MEHLSTSDIPVFPRLRAVDPQWIEYQGQQLLYLRDPMGLAEESVLIPQPLVPILGLCDGTRDAAAIQTAFMLRSGIQLTQEAVADIIAQLDMALLLENGTYQRAAARALQDYREATHRPPSHAGLVYPDDPDALSAAFQEYCDKAPPEDAPYAPNARLVGMLCPHIDYNRGHLTYAQLWQRAAPYLEDIELAIILGTDHSGGLGRLTPTRQSYATPLGALPTDAEIVDGLAEVLGQDRVYAEEIHHVREHSIELALVWFHHFMKGRACPVVPILCGSFHHFIKGQGSPAEDESISAALDFLKEATRGRRTLVIAAADLAHMGPAFGDPQPIDPIARARLTAEDRDSLADICRGDAEAFLSRSRQEIDARRICGLAPIYMALKLLDGSVQGESLGYDQCPADPQGWSVVSIAGALLYESP